MLQVRSLVVTPFAQNCRIIADAQSKTAVVVDPGGDVPLIEAELQKLGCRCVEIWLTHSHLDHCGGVAALKQKTNAQLIAHPGEREMRAHVRDICAMYGLPAGEMQDCPEPERELVGGEVLSFGGQDFRVLFTPGHSPGHVVFYQPELKILLAGDTLFQGSIGRTDLPGGDYDTLMGSIHSKILSLPDDTRVLPGHGDETTVGIEKRSNPFLQEGGNV
ncbi:MAG: MBL fold metallo-hydrolase [Deltaproteobacteria bacterium]|nr:MBL fold metallo-hydrolase [Deltaproteobacteria bacterium]